MEYPAREDERGDLSKCEYSQTGTMGSARCSHPGEFESGDGRRLCLFHWDPEDVKGRRRKDGIFTARFSKLVFDFEVHHEDTSFGVRLDCRGFVFPEGFSFFNGRVVPPADFHFARFARGTQFIRATFTEGARFHWAEFGGNTLFDGANLGDGASFGGAILGERISFDRAIFGAAASFIRAKFGAGACFFGTRFGRGSMFDGANFDCDATFLGAEFGEDASFERTRFGHSTLFVESRFGDGAWFTDAAFGDRSGFWRTEFLGSASFAGIQVPGSLEFCGKKEDAEFRVFQPQGKCTINFERMNLARPEQVSFRSVSFQRVSFMDTDLSQVLFENTAWPADGAGNKTFPGKIEDGEFKAQSGADFLTRLEGLCHQLRINYENHQNYAEAGEFGGPRWSTGGDGAFFAVRET